MFDALFGQIETAGVPPATLFILGVIREDLAFLGNVLLAALAAVRRPSSVPWADVARVLERVGADGVPIVALLLFLVGLIIAFQSAVQLERFGATVYVADAVAVSITTELGPLMTAIVIAGRSGPALAAELGMMKVNEELNALETMGLDPIRFLVVQRVVAVTLLAPVLTAYAMAVGVLGGVLVMVTLGFPVGVTWSQLQGAVGAHDVLVGVTKGVVFGTLTAGLSCLRGLQARLGPTAVGEATTRAVVSSILAVFVADGLFAVLTYILGV